VNSAASGLRLATEGDGIPLSLQCGPGPDFGLGERELEASMKLLTEMKVVSLLLARCQRS